MGILVFSSFLGKMTKLYLTVALVLGTLLVAVNGLTINVDVDPANGQPHFIRKHYSLPPTELGDYEGAPTTVITEVIGQGSFKVNENNPSDYANGAPVAMRRNVSVNVKSVNYTWREATGGGFFVLIGKEKIKKRQKNRRERNVNGDVAERITTKKSPSMALIVVQLVFLLASLGILDLGVENKFLGFDFKISKATQLLKIILHSCI